MIVLIMTIILLSSISQILAGEVKAAILPITKADLYSKGTVCFFRYGAMGIDVEVIVYQKDGIEYPA